MLQRLSRETNHRSACLVSGSAPETAPPPVRNVQYARGDGAGDGPVATLTGCDTALNLSAAAGQNSPGENSIQLERECQSYTRYLIGQAPTRYMIEKYQDFHQKMGAANSGRFERFLVSASARGPLWARLADSYATVWRKNSSVRQKLVLMLALIECAPPGFEYLDRCPGGGLPGITLRLGLGAMSYACSLFAATALFAPIHLWMTVRER